MQDPGSSSHRTAESILAHSHYGHALSLEEARICAAGSQPFVGVVPTLIQSVERAGWMKSFTATYVYTRHSLSQSALSALQSLQENGDLFTADELLDGQRIGLSCLDAALPNVTCRLITRKTYETLQGKHEYFPGETNPDSDESDGGVKLDPMAEENPWDPVKIAWENRFGPVPTFDDVKKMYLSGKPISLISVSCNTVIGEDGTLVLNDKVQRNSNRGDHRSVGFDRIIEYGRTLVGLETFSRLRNMSKCIQSMDDETVGGER